MWSDPRYLYSYVMVIKRHSWLDPLVIESHPNHPNYVRITNYADEHVESASYQKNDVKPLISNSTHCFALTMMRLDGWDWNNFERLLRYAGATLWVQKHPQNILDKQRRDYKKYEKHQQTCRTLTFEGCSYVST